MFVFSWPACCCFPQRVFAQRPSSCCLLPPRRRGRVAARVGRQAKRSPNQIPSLLAFTCISRDMCLIPIKRWFSLDSLHNCKKGEKSRFRGLKVEVNNSPWSQGGVNLIGLFFLEDGDSLQTWDGCGMFNACETVIVLSKELDLILFAPLEGKATLLFSVHVSCNDLELPMFADFFFLLH